MKIVCHLLLYLCCGSLFAQELLTNTVYKLNTDDQPLTEILSELEATYGMLFSYKDSDVDQLSLTSSYSSEDFTDFIANILMDTDLGFEIVDNNYIILSAKQEATICGTLLGIDGSPLIGASVSIAGSGQGTISDAQGHFSYKTKFSKTQQVVLSYIGYKDKALPYTSLATCPTLALELDVLELTEVSITEYITDGIDLDAQGYKTTLTPDKIAVLPGQTEPDVLNTLSYLPGIVAPSSKVGELFVRGGTPDQNLILWEGIPIYHSAHYFGTISSLDPHNIESVEVLRGGFGAEYGGRVSSVVDISAPGIDTKQPKLGIGTSMTHMFVNGALPIGETTAISYSLRRSFSELLETPTINNFSRFNQQGLILGNQELSILDKVKVNSDFAFIDTQLKLTQQIGERSEFTAAVVYMDNMFVGQLTDDDRDGREDVTQNDTMVLSNTGMTIEYKYQWSDRLSSTVKGLHTEYNYDYRYDLVNIDNNRSEMSGLKQNGIKDRQVSLDNTYKFRKGSQLLFGYRYGHYDVDFDVIREGTGRDIDEGGDDVASLQSLYFSYTSALAKKLSYQAGLRVNNYSLNSNFYFEPRFRLNYRADDKIHFSASYGQHYQYVAQYSEIEGNESGLAFPIWSLTASRQTRNSDSYMPIQSAHNFQLGLVYDYKSWLIDVQVYRKDVDGLSSRSYELDAVTEEDDDVLTGRSNTKGLDVLVKKRIDKWHTWLSYSLSKSTLNFGKQAGNTFPSNFDMRNVLQWTNQLKFDKLVIALGLKYSSGLPYSVITDFRLNGNGGQMSSNDSYTYIYDGVNNYNLPAIKELNFSAQYSFVPSSDSWKAYLTMSLTNLLNANNIYDRTYYVEGERLSDATIEKLDKSNLLFTPNVNLRFEF